MDESTPAGQVTRREVLKKGLIGAAGLTVLPAVIAACSSNAASPTPAPAATPAPGTPAPATPTPGPATPAPLSGTVTLGSNYSDAVPKKAMAGHGRRLHGQDHRQSHGQHR